MPERVVTLGDHLRKRRAELQWPRTRVARELGVHPESVRNWEHGDEPAGRNWPKVISFLGYNPREEIARAKTET